MNGRRQRIASQ